MSKPWMPLYVADYRKDTAHLSAAEHGAYLLLIMHYWSTGSLPDEDRQLARIAAMTAGEWRRARPVVQAFFHDGWKHKRIDAELSHAEEVSSKRRAAAEQKHSKSSANAPANAEQLHTHARATSQSQSHPEGEEPSGARKRATRLPSDWVPSAEDFEFAHGKGVPHAQIRVEAEKFRNHWTAKAGRDASKIDWPATWRNWILNGIEHRGRPHSNGAPRPGSKEDQRERTAEAYRALSDYVDAHADDARGGGDPGEADAGLLPLAQPPRS